MRGPASYSDVTARAAASNAPIIAVASGGVRVVERQRPSPPLHAWPSDVDLDQAHDRSGRRAATRAHGTHAAAHRRRVAARGRVGSVESRAGRDRRRRCARGTAARAPRHGAARRRRRPLPWIASSGTRALARRRSCALASDRARRRFRAPRFITVSAVNGDAAAPHAMPRMRDDRAHRVGVPHAEHRRERGARRHADDDDARRDRARQRSDVAHHRRDDRRLARAGRGREVEPVPAAVGIRALRLLRHQHVGTASVGERVDPRSLRTSLRPVCLHPCSSTSSGMPRRDACSRAARRADSFALRPCEQVGTRSTPDQRERAAFDPATGRRLAAEQARDRCLEGRPRHDAVL